MPEKHDRSLLERVEQLEARVAELQRALKTTEEAAGQARLKDTGFPPKTPDREQSGEPAISPHLTLPPKSRKTFELPENMRRNEYWLNKIGIGLLLFGVAFLFKYSIDQGWLTPPVRIGFGLILGLVLVVTGVRISAARRHFSQVLIGGGIATFYITGFAAFQVFSLISHPVAFTFMVAVTLLAFILSLKQSEAVLALIGAIGGLGTPFLLYTGTGNLPGLVGYTCLVLSGTGAIYFYHGWRSLLWTSVIGGWLVFSVGLDSVRPADPMAGRSGHRALQSGIIFGWLVFWLLPLVREFVSSRHPQRWRQAAGDSGEESASGNAGVLQRHVHVLSVSMPLIALGMSMPIWSLSSQTWGWITMAGALFYGLAAWCLSRLNAISHFSYTHSLAGAMLLTIAFYLLLDGNALFFALAAEASVVHLLARRLSDRRTAGAADILFALAGLWLLQRIFYGQAEGTAIFNIQALTDLSVIGMALAVSRRFSSFDKRRVYLILGHIFILGWFLRELSSLPNGQGYVSIAWGTYAVVLLVLGLRLNFPKVRTVAVGTLLIVVGKLFIVDLAELETIWRVLLFLGFGGLFLVLSYYFRALWKSSSEAAD